QGLGAVLVDEAGAHQRLHRRRGRDRQRAPRQLLGEEAVRHHVSVGAAVLLGIAEAEIPELADTFEELGRKLRALVDRLRRRYHLAVDESRDGLAKLFLLGGELNHVRAVLISSRRRRVASASTDSSAPEPPIPTPYSRRAASIET